ncbi:hypothetical protein ARMGADRAFT_1015515 [Armillaria gallica]|uniref:Uncharacterized protein n=1 Tax=Armillaria gallica TaxID=47427 RepID=A0A2H3D6F9_ARMGA|nr:hypothetical protein ARMGADRAFT_1015515 [Armillaria gallica]
MSDFLLRPSSIVSARISAGVQVVDLSEITFLGRIPLIVILLLSTKVIHLSSSAFTPAPFNVECGEGHIVAADPVRHAGTVTRILALCRS